MKLGLRCDGQAAKEGGGGNAWEATDIDGGWAVVGKKHSYTQRGDEELSVRVVATVESRFKDDRYANNSICGWLF